MGVGHAGATVHQRFLGGKTLNNRKSVPHTCDCDGRKVAGELGSRTLDGRGNPGPSRIS